MKRRILLAALASSFFLASFASAQGPAIKRTVLQKADLGDGREAIVGIAEIAPGGATGRHTHFGTEIGYVLEGNTVLEIEGEPVRTLKPGDSYTIPAGRVHNAKALEGSTKVLATYVVDKDKPLAVAAP